MVNQDGWELFDITQPTTSHPEEEVQRRQLAAKDAARRAQLPAWELTLPEAEAAVAEKATAVETARVALDAAFAANAAKYKQVTGARAVRDPLLGLPIHWLDDERCEPELSRRRLAEQVLSAARGELSQAVAWRDWVNAEICFIRGTVPATAP